MKILPRIPVFLLVFTMGGAPAARAAAAGAGAASVSTASEASGAPPGYPHLKLSYRYFAISNLDASDVPLQGLELDAYPVSGQWGRGGFEVEGGLGHAALNGAGVGVKYALLGVTAGFQYAAPLTPFVEGRLVGGLLSGNPDETLTMGSSPAATTLRSTSAVTWIYGRGIDAGFEVFFVGHAYLSAAVGWLHTTWGGVDYAAALQDPAARLRPKNLEADSFTFKLGIGI